VHVEGSCISIDAEQKECNETGRHHGWVGFESMVCANPGNCVSPKPGVYLSIPWVQLATMAPVWLLLALCTCVSAGTLRTIRIVFPGLDPEVTNWTNCKYDLSWEGTGPPIDGFMYSEDDVGNRASWAITGSYAAWSFTSTIVSIRNGDFSFNTWGNGMINVNYMYTSDYRLIMNINGTLGAFQCTMNNVNLTDWDSQSCYLTNIQITLYGNQLTIQTNSSSFMIIFNKLTSGSTGWFSAATLNTLGESVTSVAYYRILYDPTDRPCDSTCNYCGRDPYVSPTASPTHHPTFSPTAAEASQATTTPLLNDSMAILFIVLSAVSLLVNVALLIAVNRTKSSPVDYHSMESVGSTQ
jgi:hypothetical protein